METAWNSTALCQSRFAGFERGRAFYLGREGRGRKQHRCVLEERKESFVAMVEFGVRVRNRRDCLRREVVLRQRLDHARQVPQQIGVPHVLHTTIHDRQIVRVERTTLVRTAREYEICAPLSPLR